METLVVVAQHRNQYYGRSKGHSPGKFGSPPSRGFRDINCRTFESGAGLLPSPWKGYATSILDPYSKTQPRTHCVNKKSSSASKVEDGKPVKKNMKSSSSPIPIDFKSAGSMKERRFCDNSCFSELWAGPTYSNSPPPSSLPIPKFSMKPKRTVSLELPVCDRDICFEHLAKSAPASPTREMDRSSSISFLKDDDSATKTLRRILNLDITDA